MTINTKKSFEENITLPSDGDHSGRNLGKEEIALLTKVIKSGTLWSVRGTMVKQFEKEFADKYQVKFSIAASSGTAAIHSAVAAINPNPGDEIITTPITDMGAIAPILYQNAVPVFADVDPLTLNVTAETIEPKITRRTKAMIVTHLFGNPCDMEPILRIAQKYHIPIIEDCCQAYLAEYRGQKVGTMGDIGCFSLQQSKHITSGEGGVVISNNTNYAERIKLFVNKAWGYGDPNPDHYFLALNYRMTELQGAVALTQLHKLENVINKRQRTAEILTKILKKEPILITPQIVSGAKHAYWRYHLRVKDNAGKCDVEEIANKLKEKGIQCIGRYIKKPAFMCQVFRDRKTYGSSECPFECSFRATEPKITYHSEDYPSTMDGLAHVLVFPWNEFYRQKDVLYIAHSIIEVIKNTMR